MEVEILSVNAWMASRRTRSASGVIAGAGGLWSMALPLSVAMVIVGSFKTNRDKRVDATGTDGTCGN